MDSLYETVWSGYSEGQPRGPVLGFATGRLAVCVQGASKTVRARSPEEALRAWLRAAGPAGACRACRARPRASAEGTRAFGWQGLLLGDRVLILAPAGAAGGILPCKGIGQAPKNCLAKTGA